jgi:hypothetical protein
VSAARWPDVGLAGLVLAFTFLAASFVARNSDLWLHLATGRLLARGEYVFGTDPFAYTTAGAYWANHAWLFDLVLFAGHHALGGAGLVAVKAVAVAALAGLLLRLAQPASSSGPFWVGGACVLLAVLTMSPRLLLQPACLSLLLLAVCLWLLLRGGRALLALPVLCALWVTNYENELHGLYANLSANGDVLFDFQTKVAGIAVIGQKNVGWGTGFIDFDLDGWEDLFVSNGHAIRFPTAPGVTRRQRPTLLMNRGRGRFLPAGKRLGPYGQEEHLGRGVAFVDLDNDGRVDVVLAHMNEPAVLLRNVAPEKHSWLGLELVGAGHADVVGARVVLEAGGRAQTRFARGGGSYASSSDRRLVFGLGRTDRIDKLSVTWPDGRRQEWGGLAVDNYHVLVQGEKAARPYRVRK